MLIYELKAEVWQLGVLFLFSNSIQLIVKVNTYKHRITLVAFIAEYNQ